MVSFTSLLLPTLVAAVIVFVVSSVIHAVLSYHRSDFRELPKQDEVMDALRGFDLEPGDYVFPFSTPENMKTDEFKAKVERGPVALMTVMSGMPGMGKSLIQWFVYCLAVGYFAGYVAAVTLPEGSHYLVVFRIVGTTAFAGYSLALAQASIWYHKSWSATAKSMVDGLVYALLTAGAFGWLWPRG
jgi:hypothetical protein